MLGRLLIATVPVVLLLTPAQAGNLYVSWDLTRGGQSSWDETGPLGWSGPFKDAILRADPDAEFATLEHLDPSVLDPNSPNHDNVVLVLSSLFAEGRLGVQHLGSLEFGILVNFVLRGGAYFAAMDAPPVYDSGLGLPFGVVIESGLPGVQRAVIQNPNHWLTRGVPQIPALDPGTLQLPGFFPFESLAGYKAGGVALAAMDRHGMQPCSGPVVVLGDSTLLGNQNYINTPVFSEAMDRIVANFIKRVNLRAGDVNCDRAVNGGDIDPFFLALGDPAAYQTRFPDCDIAAADINGDGVVNGADVDAFFECLINGDCLCP
ncbi:MAG: hypothetical protein IH986_08435 [Planctomycetes bacterium]|nr:hypothetical protein [Planctomycetota bacterium]